MFRPIHVTIASVLLAGGLAAATLDAQSASAPRKGYQFFITYRDRFTFEYPSKDWELVSGGASSLLTLTQKKREATVVVEYQPLHLELAANEIDDNFAKLESEPITTRQPDVNGVGMRLLDVGSSRIVVVDFSRRGVTGMERVRQYSLPVGKHLYRLVCSAPVGAFSKYEPVFTTIVETFRVAGAPAPSAAAAPAAAPKKR
jgi:hypothetical protein